MSTWADDSRFFFTETSTKAKRLAQVVFGGRVVRMRQFLLVRPTHAPWVRLRIVRHFFWNGAVPQGAGSGLVTHPLRGAGHRVMQRAETREQAQGTDHELTACPGKDRESRLRSLRRPRPASNGHGLKGRWLGAIRERPSPTRDARSGVFRRCAGMKHNQAKAPIRGQNAAKMLARDDRLGVVLLRDWDQSSNRGGRALTESCCGQ
jgi:hypothetical protein